MKIRKLIALAVLAAGISTVALEAGASEPATEKQNADAQASGNITETQAKEIALADAGLTEDDLTSIKVRQDREDGLHVYTVKFWTADYAEYDYDITIAEGMIYNASYEVNVIGTLSGAAVSQEEAQSIALEHAGEDAADVTFTKVKTDRDNGRNIYELEFTTANDKEYEYDIDTDTGVILSWSYDAKYYMRWLENNPENSGVSGESGTQAISGLEEAQAAVLEMLGAASEADVTWSYVSEKYRDGRLVYEGKLFYDSMEFEFELDARTGAWIEWDSDWIHD